MTLTFPNRFVLSLLALQAVACVQPRDASQLGPQDTEKMSRAEYDLARAEWEQGRLRSAMAHAIKASELDESHADAHDFVANVFLAICQVDNDCRFDEAEKYAQKAVKVNPTFLSAQQRLGLILNHRKKFDEAIQILSPLSKNIVYKTPWLALNELAFAHLNKGDVDLAIDALQLALKRNPSFCWANYRLGLAWEKKGDFNQAESELTKSVTPPDPACTRLQDAYEARARVRLKLEKKEDAMRDYEVCSQLSLQTPTGQLCQRSLRTLKGSP